MKILVPLKRVADPDNANKVKIPASGDKIETTGLEWKPNPFDEYALEAALRLTENGQQPKTRAGEVVVVTFGPKETEQTLRAALATGADKAFYEGKIAAASFFVKNVLPKLAGERAIAEAIDASVMELDEAAF